MMVDSYVTQKCFEDISANQIKLIDILNHRMTKLEKNVLWIKTDVSWLKKILWVISGLLTSILIAIILKGLSL